MGLSLFTLCSRVRHWDRLWSSPIQGRGDCVGWVGLAVVPRPVDSRLRGNDGEGCQRGIMRLFWLGWVSESVEVGFFGGGVATDI